jgi:hypothetical protein
MNKVAICLKGAVSKKGTNDTRFYNKGDLYRPGEYVEYQAVRNCIFRHIVECNPEFEFDFFLHGWNLDLQDDLNRLYQPKKSLFESNSNYDDIISSIIQTPSDFGGVSSSLSIKKTLELKEIFEIEQNIMYDLVIIYRYDVLLWKNMILKNYKIDSTIYVNSWDESCNADFHFVMSNENSKKFKYLYDSVYLYNNYHKFHYWIKNYIVNILKIDLKEDDIQVGLFQEHLRVIGDKPTYGSLQHILLEYL